MSGIYSLAEVIEIVEEGLQDSQYKKKMARSPRGKRDAEKAVCVWESMIFWLKKAGYKMDNRKRNLEFLLEMQAHIGRHDIGHVETMIKDWISEIKDTE